MSQKFATTLSALRSRVGHELGVTEWKVVSQRDADMFSAWTDDWDYMHNDPEWATPRLGGTIAHGLYVLGFVPSYTKEVAPDLPIVASEDTTVLNYGFDKVRFVSPLLIGQRYRDRISLIDISERKPNEYLMRLRHTIEKEGDEKPFLSCDALSYFVDEYREKWA